MLCLSCKRNNIMSEYKHKQNEASPEGGWPKSTGMTVPEGYFDSFAARMMEQIPAEEPRVVEMPRRGFWKTVRPYVYMAAMFAGIWLMMNMFTLFSPGVSSPSQSLLADVTSVQSESYLSDYMADVSDYDLYDGLYDAGFDIPETL